MRVVSLALLLVATSTARPVLAQDGGRLALVIGIAKYRDADAPLPTAIPDARAVAAELKKQGFAVDAAEDVTKSDPVGPAELPDPVRRQHLD